MPVASPLEEVYNNFLENHILLRDDWLKDALEFVQRHHPTATGRRLYLLLFEQWLFSDLADSSHPSLDGVDGGARKTRVEEPLLLQITSLVDVGCSLLSQFNKLTYEFVDNSGFEVDASMQKEDNLYQAKPSRCLMLTLSDGQTELRAMERRAIPALSLLTSPGCKLLLRPPLSLRKGVLLLTASNCQVLGGDDPVLMESGRPLEVMARLLKKDIPRRRSFSHLGGPPPSSEEPEPMDEEEAMRAFEEMDDQFDPADFEPTPAPVIRTTVSPASARPSPTVPSSIARPVPSTVPPTPTVPTPRPLKRSIEPSTPHLQNTQSAASSIHSTKSTPASCSRGTPAAAAAAAAPGSVQRVIKSERVEVIDLDDEEAVASTSAGRREETSSSSGDTVDESDRFVAAYRGLRLISLEDAVKQSRFQTAGSKRRIEAVVDKFIAPLRIVDDLWTMNVRLQDGSPEGVDCIVHSTVLEKLIGLTVEEANQIRTCADIERKKEGKRRIDSTEDIMSRMDLIWTVEFYPAKSKVMPVVRDIKTLAEILDAFD